MNAPSGDKHVDRTDDVRMPHRQNDLDLARKELRLVLSAETGYHLNSDRLMRQHVRAQTDLAIHALADQAADRIVIVDAALVLMLGRQAR